MDLDQNLIKVLSQKIGISETNIIHEFYELQILREISLNYLLSKNLIFKGGTAFRLIYLSERYSDDLDFDLKEDADPEEILKELIKIAKKINYKITDQEIKRNTILLELSYEKGFKKIKLEISKIAKNADQKSIIKNVLNQVFPYSINLRTYPLEILMAGKIHAVLFRKRRAPRDIYDLFYFFSQNIEFDLDYFNQNSEGEKNLNRAEIYSHLLKTIDLYNERQIKNELNTLLPKEKRQWVIKNLKSRLKEILQIKVNKLLIK